MLKSVRETELDRLIDEITRHPHGIGLNALLTAIGGSPARRTLQRRLAALALARRLVTEGEGRAFRYRATPNVTMVSTSDWSAPSGVNVDDLAPTSSEGNEIKANVRRPLHLRQPASYNIGFLEDYVPNGTSYLSESLRVQLHDLGRSDVDAQAAAGTFARDILNRLLIDLSWASSRLEGNTYTRLDTERLIEFDEAADGRSALETQMILNHKAAIEYLVGDIHVAIDEVTIFSLHALLSDGLLRDPMAGGRVRRRVVEISGSVYRPIALPQKLEELLGHVMHIAAEIVDPFEQAFFLMVHLPYLQPFEDVNKRVSRLAANIPLMRHNLCPLSFIDVPSQSYVDAMLGVYELTRVELLRDVFVWAYERSCQQYVAVRAQLIPPDTFRLRYRAELGAAIKAIIQRGLPLDDPVVSAAIPAPVKPEDRVRFAELMRAEFKNLHEGNAIRFGLRPLEFAVWKNGSRERS